MMQFDKFLSRIFFINVTIRECNFAMGTILGKGFAQAQVHTNHNTSAEGTSAVICMNVCELDIHTHIYSYCSLILRVYVHLLCFLHSHTYVKGVGLSFPHCLLTSRLFF